MAIPLLAMLYLYSNTLSYLMPPRCRFYPSCSQYAYQAIKAHGVVAGLLLSARRLLKCHPWHPGGFDYVPEKPSLSCCHKTRGLQPTRNLQS